MTGDAEPSGPGLLNHARELSAAALEYLRARLQLAGLETKEALFHFAIIAGLLAGAIAVVIFGYLFLCIALVALLAFFLKIHFGWVLLAFALAHFAVALACLLIAKTRLSTAVFGGTLSELKKDQQWLSNHAPK